MEWPPPGCRLVEKEREKQRKSRYRRIRNKAREHYRSGAAKPPLPLHYTANTPALTNGERGDNSDGSGSMREGGYASGQERSRDSSRERSPAGSLEPEYGVIQSQPRSRGLKKPVPRRHTVGGRTLKTKEEEETERSKEAFMDMLATRYPQYAEKISSTASEDGFPVRGRSRDPRRRATVVTYNPQHNRSLEYDDIGTMSEVDAPTFHRGGYVRSSLPAARTPTIVDQPTGLVFLIFRDETKKALLPNEITHLDTVRAMFVRSFPGKLTMSFLESPKRKIYILDPRTNIYYQLEELKDIKDRTVLRIHETDSMEPQRVAEHPEVRGRTLQIPAGPIPGHSGSTPSSAITSQVHKTQQPSSMHSPLYVSHDEISQSPSRSSYGGERSRSLTPDPARMANYAQNPIYGRMGISPERPPPPQERMTPSDRPPMLRPIPENRQMQNGHQNNANAYQNFTDAAGQYHQAPGAPSPVPTQGQGHPRHPHRQAMSPPALPTTPRSDPGRRAFSPPASLKHYDYIQVVPASQSAPGAPTGSYVAKGVRASTVVTPHRTSATPSQAPTGQQQTSQALPTWRERSPVGRHTLAFTSAPYSGMSNSANRSQSYRVTPSAEREPVFIPPRSMTPQPAELETRDRIDKMELQLANLAAWVQTAVAQTGSTGAPSSGKTTSPSLTSGSASPVVDTASSMMGEDDRVDGLVKVAGGTDVDSDDTAIVLSQDMRNKILGIKKQAEDLRADLRSLRRLHQINKESIIETVDDAWKKIKKALASVPGAERLLVRQQRQEVDQLYRIYLDDKARADKELGDLEAAVEELRSDVLSRQCRVNMSDVEGMALVLSHVTKALGDLKVRFQQLMDQLKVVMSAEMEVIVMEEKFLKEEPEKLDQSLKKCKKLTGTLFTLKRLASVQEHRPPQIPTLTAQAKIPTMQDKKALLDNIEAMIPNHDARVQSLQAAETSRQRKKKITTQQEALRFGKSLEMASKALKSSGAVPSTGSGETITSGAKSSHTYPPHSGSSMSDTASILSFANPMSTSTPKSSSSTSSTSKEASLTSLSLTQPTVSLIRAVTPRKNLAKKDFSKPSDQDREPAVISVTSSMKSHPGVHTSKSKSTTMTSEAPTSSPTELLSSQKSAARAAFFSSLSSPITPTTTSDTMTIIPGPSLQSPTEPHSRVSHSQASPVRSIPLLVRSSAVTTISASSTSSVVHSRVSSSSLVHKPSTLPVASTSSVVSSQNFSPASPTSTSTKSQTVFSTIPKPYSPTKSTTSPVTPESPRYRIPPSQLSRGSREPGSRSVSTSKKDSATKQKRVPPPPPPRKSSRLPGHAVLAVNTAMNGKMSSGRVTEINGARSEGKLEHQSKLPPDVIDPPKAFATPELESSKSRSKSSSVITSKKISRSNLDSGEKVLKFEKDIELCAGSREEEGNGDVVYDTVKKDQDGKVSNIEGSPKHRSSRASSIDSTSSSSSLDSQQEVIWLRRKEMQSSTISSDIISSTTITSSVLPSTSVTMPTDVSVSIVSSVPVSSGVPQLATKADLPSASTKDTATATTASVAMETQAAESKSGSKKPKPAPPERRSSLSSRSQTEIDPGVDSETKLKKEKK